MLAPESSHPDCGLGRDFLLERVESVARQASPEPRSRPPKGCAMNEESHAERGPSAAGDPGPTDAAMAREGVALSAMARVLKQVAHASALRLPVELVDDAAQEAWARWLAAGGEAGEERQRADPSAYLVGIFHHVCADAVRAHRRRQRWCALAADLGVEPAELVDERPARGLGGGHRAPPRAGGAPRVRRAAVSGRRALDRCQGRGPRLASGGRGGGDGPGGDPPIAAKNSEILEYWRRAQTT